ncbi:MAG TPA: hypothetical protein EYP10_08540, partial [Armatimonadetes bacterium]|nr:hypothetical protein [Armatimonadota bacterium]
MMLVLRCPRCGTVTYEGHFTFPVCHKCHENLLKCRYCRHYPGDGRRCHKVADNPYIHGDDVRACPSYRSTLQNPATVWGMSRISAVACILISAILGIIVAVVSILPTPSQLRDMHFITINCPREAVRGKRLVAVLRISHNVHEQPTTIRISIPRKVLDAFAIVQVTPIPDWEVKNERGWVCGYSRADGSTKPFAIKFTIEPLRNGVHQLRLEVTEEYARKGIARWEAVNWRINVVDKPPAQKRH